MATAALDREQALPAQRVTAALDRPGATLVRLFTLGDPVDAAEAAAAAAHARRRRRGGAGPGRARGGRRRRAVRPAPVRRRRASTGGSPPTSARSRPGAPCARTTCSASVAPRRPWRRGPPRPHVDRALDLGTGCGVQALHLEGHADEVVVTDLSERALAFARFNAALDEVEWDAALRLDARPGRGASGSGWSSATRRSSSPRGRARCRFRVPRRRRRRGCRGARPRARRSATTSNPAASRSSSATGRCPRGTTWTERVAPWLEGTGLDAWVVQREVQDPAEYAETWARDGGHHPGTRRLQRDVRRVARRLRRPRRRGDRLRGRHAAAPARPTGRPFRRPDGRHWPVAAPMGPRSSPGSGPHLARRARRRRGARHRVACAPDVTRSATRCPVRRDPTVILLRQGGGLGGRPALTRSPRRSLGLRRRADRRAAPTAIAGLLDLDGEVRAEVVAFLRDAVKDGLLADARPLGAYPQSTNRALDPTESPPASPDPAKVDGSDGPPPTTRW